MRAKTAKRVETTSAACACVALGAACAYAANAAFEPLLAPPARPCIAIALGGFVNLLAGFVLRYVGNGGPARTSATFDLFTIPVEPQADELLLTDVYRAEVEEDAEPLVLDDILVELAPDSRVVRLFDRTAMPTPAQLKSRIDAHLSRTGAEAAAPDASQALHDALAELRRSMR